MHRLAIKEGWSTFLLAAVVAMTAAWSTEAADWTDGLGILTRVALIAIGVALVLSLIPRLPALLAHLIALALGALVVIWAMTGYLSDELGGRHAKTLYLWHRWQEWFSAVSHGQHAEDLYLFVLLMAVLIWLVSYLSIWLVLRAHWIWLALVLPGAVLFANLGYSQHVPNGLLVLYLFASLLLLMRFSFARREERWRLTGIPYPRTLVWRALWVASYISLAVLLFGWVFPVTPQSRSVATAWNEVNGPWVNLRDTVNSWFGSLRGPNPASGPGGFASFSDQFSVGGPLRLSANPVVVVKGGSAPYLVAHTYSVFTGSGWKSDEDATQSGLLSLQSGQQFPLPASSSEKRTATSFEVQVLQTRGAVVYSSDELGSVSVPTQAQVSWHYYTNQPLDVAGATAQDSPPLLWPLVQLLKAADFTPPPPPDDPATPAATPGTTPVATPDNSAVRQQLGIPNGNGRPFLPRNIAAPNLDSRRGLGQPENWTQIQNTLNQLQTQNRLQLQVALGDDYTPKTLTFSGYLPVYADLQALYNQDGMRNGDRYTVTAETSQATVAELRGASTAYPSELTSRYLQLPKVTQRVQDLAHALTDSQPSAYDKAVAVEQYLRTNYKYNENVPALPQGRDLVDYFLFDNKQGYCTYYSSSMVELLRVVGIPAREVVGFYPAGYDNGAQGFLYRDLNSHAWVEAYFPGYGWIPFEPTAARGEIARYQPPAPAQADNGAGGSTQVPTEGNGRLADENLADPGVGGPAVVAPHTTKLAWTLRALLVALVGGVAAFAFFWLRGLRGLSPTSQLFVRLQRGASWGGVPVSASMTPYEYAAAVSQRVPGTRTHASLLAALYVRERYGSRPVGTDDLSRARHAWLRLRSLLVRYALLQRWRTAARDLAEEDGF